MRAPLLVTVAFAALAGCSRPQTLASFEGDITMHTTTPKDPPHDLLLKAKGDKLRFEMTGPGGEPSHAIYDPAAADKVVLLIDSRKMYMPLDFSAKGAPAPNTDPTASTIQKTGTHKLVAGYDCEQWSAKDPSGRHSEVCIAQGIAFFDLSRMRAGGAEAESALAKEFREHKSFPLESVEFDTDGKEISRMEVVKITPGTVADADFAIPAGYTKMELPARK
jgi:hypothetical protein